MGSAKRELTGEELDLVQIIYSFLGKGLDFGVHSIYGVKIW